MTSRKGYQNDLVVSDLGVDLTVGHRWEVQWVFRGSASGGFLGQTRMFYQCTQANLPGNNEQLAAVIRPWLLRAWAAIENFVPLSVKLAEVTWVPIVEGAQGWSFQLDDAGLNITNPVLPQCAVGVTYYCGKLGRRYRNRGYWPGLASGEHDGGVLDTDSQAAFVAFMNALAAVSGNATGTRDSIFTLKHGVYSQPGANNTPAAEWNERTGFAVRGNLRTQRRRAR